MSCLTGNKKETHTILLTEYDRGVKVNSGTGVFKKHLHGRVMIPKLVGKGVFDLNDNVTKKKKKKKENVLLVFSKTRSGKKLIGRHGPAHSFPL